MVVYTIMGYSIGSMYEVLCLNRILGRWAARSYVAGGGKYQVEQREYGVVRPLRSYLSKLR